MRLALVCTEKLPVPPVRGGAIQTYIDGIVPHLRDQAELTVICRRDPLLPDVEVSGGVWFRRVPGGDAAAYAHAVADLLGTLPPQDGVVIFNRPASVPVVAAAVPGARLFLSMHNDMFEPDRLSPAVARAVLERVETVVTVSDYVRRTIDGLHPGFGHKLRVIRSGVDTDRFRPVWAWPAGEREQIRRRWGLPPEGPVILYVSRFSPKKGNHLVIEAMAEVRRHFPAAMLLMAGSSRYGSDDLDPYGVTLRETARAKLGQAVCLTGFVPPAHLPPLFAAGDLFVCASQWEEPLARVHYEAMAAGLPIVTTDRGGNAEVMEEGQNGLIARPHHDPAAFVAAIATLLGNPAQRDRMGRYGRHLAETRYTWARVAVDWKAVLAGG
jgi:spore coat protein SA